MYDEDKVKCNFKYVIAGIPDIVFCSITQRECDGIECILQRILKKG